MSYKINLYEEKFKYFIHYFKVFKNPISCLLFKFSLKESVIVKSKFFGDIKISSKNRHAINLLSLASLSYKNNDFDKDNIESFRNMISDIEHDKKIVSCGDLKIHNNDGIYSFFEQISEDNYKFKNFKGSTIIDIGANAGDTALNFANKGAIVYAFEPVPQSFSIAKRNIELNPQIKGNIFLFNKAVSCKKGTLKIVCNDLVGGGQNSAFLESTSGSSIVEVETISLDDFCKEYDIDDALLKIDCEGCEVNVLKHSDLSIFSEVILEYHTFLTKVPYTELVEVLENNGFKVEVFSSGFSALDDLGIIHAYK